MFYRRSHPQNAPGAAGPAGTARLGDTQASAGLPAMPSDSFGIFSAVSSAPDRGRRAPGCSRVTEAFAALSRPLQLSPWRSLSHPAQTDTGSPGSRELLGGCPCSDQPLHNR